MKLGGFVIHGNAIETLEPCLRDLAAVCDEVVAVDSGSSDGSGHLSASLGARVIRHPWQGYGSARATAAQALSHCDYVFFLDSDERLAEGTREVIARWKRGSPDQPYYRIRRHDWAELPTGRFVFRTERRKRLIRIDAARWTPEMVVHESIEGSGGGEVPGAIDHRFATSLEGRERKNDLYALLWAVQEFRKGRRAPAPAPRQLGHWLRNGLLKGAWLRGGMPALRLTWRVAAYHARKYDFLRAIESGKHRPLVEAFEQQRYGELFALAEAALAG